MSQQQLTPGDEIAEVADGDMEIDEGMRLKAGYIGKSDGRLDTASNNNLWCYITEYSTVKEAFVRPRVNCPLSRLLATSYRQDQSASCTISFSRLEH